MCERQQRACRAGETDLVVRTGVASIVPVVYRTLVAHDGEEVVFVERFGSESSVTGSVISEHASSRAWVKDGMRRPRIGGYAGKVRMSEYPKRGNNRGSGDGGMERRMYRAEWRTAMRGKRWKVRAKLKREETYGTRLMDALPPSFICSCLCMTSVVYGAMLSDAGKRTGASIFRAADLSAELCSKRYSVGRGAVRGDECKCRDGHGHGDEGGNRWTVGNRATTGSTGSARATGEGTEGGEAKEARANKRVVSGAGQSRDG